MCEFKASNGYVVKRLSNQQVQVYKAKGKSPSRLLYMQRGATDKPTCMCPVYGECGHQLAALEFAATERVPVEVRRSAYDVAFDALMSPTGC